VSARRLESATRMSVLRLRLQLSLRTRVAQRRQQAKQHNKHGEQQHVRHLRRRQHLDIRLHTRQLTARTRSARLSPATPLRGVQAPVKRS